MKLTLEHLAPYLPYELKMAGCQSTLSADILNRWERLEWDITPILRPLSDLTKEIEHSGENFIPVRRIRTYFQTIDGNHRNFDYSDFGLVLDGLKCGVFSLPYWVLKELFEWHFDVFGLIEKGLAININEI